MSLLFLKNRKSMKPETMAALMRVSFRKLTLSKFPALQMAGKWVQNEMRADDPTYNDDHLRKRAKLVEEEEDEELEKEQLEGKSMLY